MTMKAKPLSRKLLRAALVQRRPDDHKGTFGHALIVAGSKGMMGAAILATRAALRSGAGLVTLALPESLQGPAAAQVPEAMTIGLPESDGRLGPEAAEPLVALNKVKRFTVMAIGPGLSTYPGTGFFVTRVLKELPTPAVVDADALNNLADQPEGLLRKLLDRRKERIYTPHIGEMARCLGVSKNNVLRDREGCVRRLACEWKGVTLLKGKGSLISDGDLTLVNDSGGPGLAKGGSGDLLTGLIAGLWAQMIASQRVKGSLPILAAALGAYLHGRAGELAARDLTPWAMTSSDVLARFPAVFKRL